LKELELFDIIIIDDDILFDKNDNKMMTISSLKYSESSIKEEIKNKKTLIILNKLNVNFLKKIINKKQNISVINL
jgi:hypothetical protein